MRKFFALLFLAAMLAATTAMAVSVEQPKQVVAPTSVVLAPTASNHAVQPLVALAPSGLVEAYGDIVAVADTGPAAVIDALEMGAIGYIGAADGVARPAAEVSDTDKTLTLGLSTVPAFTSPTVADTGPQASPALSQAIEIAPASHPRAVSAIPAIQSTAQATAPLAPRMAVAWSKSVAGQRVFA